MTGTALSGKRYSAYPEYKESGVGIFGNIPKEWGVGSLRWYLSVASGEFLSNKDFKVNKDELNQYPVIGGNGVMGYAPVFNNENVLVIGRVGALCGNVHFITDKCWVTDNALKINLDTKMLPKFTELYLRVVNLNKLANHNTQPLITGTMVKDQIALIPSKLEQQKIANFLDHETAKIDTLIAKQEKLIALLKEKRQAVISHAVTRGLNPDAPMKDSGIEWLGEVPEHWFSTQIKYGYNITLGKMLTKDQKNPSYVSKPYLKAVNVQPEGISIKSVENMWFSPSELKSLRLEFNDLLISEGGDVGRSAIWQNELPECYIQNAINRARSKNNNSTKLLFYWMNMLKISGYIISVPQFLSPLAVT